MKLNRIFYEEVLDEWLLRKEKSIKYTTYCKYQYIIDYNIKPKLGKILIKKMKNDDLSKFFNDKSIVSLSDSTKKLIYIIINSSIKFAIEQKYRKQVIISNIKIKKPLTRIDYLTKKEQHELEKYLNSNLNLRNIAILFALYTGIRLGELCAIQWKDIDFINNTVYITKNVQRVRNNETSENNKTKLIIMTPKTIHSIRIVPIPIFLINILKTIRSEQENFIFTNTTKPKDPRSLEKYFKTALEKSGLRPLVFHALRHTYATRSREAGVDIKILSELLGHSSYKVTLDIYVHTSLDFKKESVNSLIKYLKPKSSRN